MVIIIYRGLQFIDIIIIIQTFYFHIVQYISFKIKPYFIIIILHL